jgi:hypothetical protein
MKTTAATTGVFATLFSLATLFLLASFAGSVSSQDSMPVEQCRTDLAAWTHDFNFMVDTTRDDLLLTYDQLKDRTSEAGHCALLDDKEPYHAAAGALQVHYSGLMKDRLHDFLVRHDMLAQFQKEDGNGLR